MGKELIFSDNFDSGILHFQTGGNASGKALSLEQGVDGSVLTGKYSMRMRFLDAASDVKTLNAYITLAMVMPEVIEIEMLFTSKMTLAKFGSLILQPQWYDGTNFTDASMRVYSNFAAATDIQVMDYANAYATIAALDTAFPALTSYTWFRMGMTVVLDPAAPGYKALEFGITKFSGASGEVPYTAANAATPQLALSLILNCKGDNANYDLFVDSVNIWKLK